MADYRCPAHDLIFETYTDQRKPGALKNEKMAAHPIIETVNGPQVGHPDCPRCIEAMKEQAQKPSASITTASVRPAGFKRIA